jgi:hypothetical protein
MGANVRYRCRVSDEAQSHTPFLRRIREGGRRNEGADDQFAVDPPPAEASTSEPPADEAGSARDGLRRALLEVGERVDAIIAGAERTAEDIRRQAQADADRYLAERRRRADALEAERNRRFQEALEALRSGASRIEAETDRVVRSVEEAVQHAEATEAAAEPLADAQQPPAPAAYPGSATGVPEGGLATPPRVSMLIRATQLAVQGHERGEIEQTLEAEFGRADVELIVDEVLGRR